MQGGRLDKPGKLGLNPGKGGAKVPGEETVGHQPFRCEVEEYPEHSSTVDYYSFFIDRIVFFFLNVCIKYNKL